MPNPAFSPPIDDSQSSSDVSQSVELGVTSKPKTAAKSLEFALSYLVRHEHATWYAFVINALERRPVRGLGTFAVGPVGSRVQLMYDPEVITKISFAELVASMEHEVLHIVLGHFSRFAKMWQLVPNNTARAAFLRAKPIAADCAVNEVLRRHHSGVGQVTRTAPKGPLGYWDLPENFDLPRGASYEAYMTELIPRFVKQEVQTRRVVGRAHTLFRQWAKDNNLPFEEGNVVGLHGSAETAPPVEPALPTYAQTGETPHQTGENQ